MRPIQKLIRRLFTKTQPTEASPFIILPHTPESIASMRERWRRALWPTCDVAKICKCPTRAYYPMDYRRHVFDTIEGFRMGLSLDRLDDRFILHASFGLVLAEANRFIPTVTRARAAFRILFQDVTRILTPPMCEDIGDWAMHWYWPDDVTWSL